MTARYFVPDALVADDAMQAEVRWSRTVDPGPSVSVTGGIVGIDGRSRSPHVGDRAPRSCTSTCARASHSIRRPPDAPRTVALAGSPGERVFPEIGGLADQTPQFMAAAEVLAGVVGARPSDLDLSGVWIEQGWLVVTAARDQVWFVSLG